MKKALAYILIISSILVLSSCTITNPLHFGTDIVGEGEFVEKVIECENCSTIKISELNRKHGAIVDNIDFNVHKSNENKIVIKSQQNIIDHIFNVQSLGTMSLHGKVTENYVTDVLTIDVYLDDIKNLDLANCKGHIETAALDENVWVALSGASKIDMDPFNMSSITLGVSGSSVINIEQIESDMTHLILSGASTINVNTIDSDVVKSSISGSSSFKANDVNSFSTQFSLSGSSIAKILNLKTESSDFSLSGSSKIDFAGLTNGLKVKNSGACEAKLADFKSIDAIIEASGGSDVEVYAKTSLKVNASGGSSVVYYGSCEVLDQDLSGGSTLKHK